MHAGTDASLFARPKEDPSVRRGLQFRDIHVRGFDPASAMRPRVDAQSLEDVSSSDAFLNKAFYLASYTNFHLKRFDTVLAEGFRHFLLNGMRVVGFVGASPPASGDAFEKEAVAIDFRILRYLPDRVDYEVNLPQRMTLVFNEMYSPGWKSARRWVRCEPHGRGGWWIACADGRSRQTHRFNPLLAHGILDLAWF